MMPVFEYRRSDSITIAQRRPVFERILRFLLEHQKEDQPLQQVIDQVHTPPYLPSLTP